MGRQNEVDVIRGVCAALALLAGLAGLAAGPAAATGVAGDRLFPATLLVEDTQNDDELSLPTLAYLKRGASGDELPPGRELGLGGEFSRLLTPDLAFTVDAGWRQRAAAGTTRRGWDNLDLGFKYRTILDAPHELLVSTAVFYEIGGTGARRIGAERFDAVQPVVSFGKGLGNLPREMDWLRPAAITGAAGVALPTGSGPKLARYGLSLQYSLVYRDRYVAPLGSAAWAKSLIPLVEFAFESPLGRSYGARTVATAAPGIAWMGEDCQILVEALLPLNSRTGRGIGVMAQAHFFLDELMPAVFGKPLFGDRD